MDEATKAGIGVALNEATMLGAEVSRERRLAALTFKVLTLPETDPPPADLRVVFLLESVGRVVASLREGAWDDQAAPVVPFPLEGLLETVRSLGCQPIYGWEFIDKPEASDDWMNRLSLDERFTTDNNAHSISLFQEGPDKHLDFKIWFDTLRVFTPDWKEVPLIEFIAGGARWWDAFWARDSRTDGHGITPCGD